MLQARCPRWTKWRLVAAVLVFFPSAVGYASQTPVTASVTTSVDRLAQGESADVRLAVSIADGWHINSNEPGQDFLIPTTIEFEVPAGDEPRR